jgi:hypothetical protein
MALKELKIILIKAFTLIKINYFKGIKDIILIININIIR